MADRVHTLWQLAGVVEGEEIAISMTGIETVLPVKLAARLQSAASLQAEHNLCPHQIPCKQATTEGAFSLRPCFASQQMQTKTGRLLACCATLNMKRLQSPTLKSTQVCDMLASERMYASLRELI